MHVLVEVKEAHGHAAVGVIEAEDAAAAEDALLRLLATHAGVEQESGVEGGESAGEVEVTSEEVEVDVDTSKVDVESEESVEVDEDCEIEDSAAAVVKG